jgi:transposase
MVAGTFVGIDVSKSRLDVAVLTDLSDASEAQTVKWLPAATNDESGIASLVEQLRSLAPKRIALEATGGYDAAAVAALALAGLPVWLVNPRLVRDFAKSRNLLAKTDKLDAAVIARFVQQTHLPQHTLPDEATELLKALVERRRQIVAMITQETNRQKGPNIPLAVRSEIEKHIDFLKAQCDDIDKEIRDQIKESPFYLEKSELLQSVPGVGEATAAALIACVPELGILSHKQIASLVGVAPHANDSGQMKGRRMVWGGRAGIRAMLYMATMSAKRCNPVIAAYFEQLKARGKAGKVAMVACMHKLLVIINAMVKHNARWQKNYTAINQPT